VIDKKEKKERKKEKRQKRRRNALVHGLYSRDVLLPWDNKDDFEKLHQELCAEFRPSGAAERETVLDLTHAFWLKRTIWRMRQAAVMADPFTAEVLSTDCKSWQEMRKELREQASTARSFQDLAMDTFSELRSQVRRLLEQIKEAKDPEEVKNAENAMAAWLRLMSDRVAPSLLLVSKFPTGEKSFNNAYVPESLEKLVRLEAAQDARIAKILVRLVGLKEFKRTPAGGGGDGGAAPLALDSPIAPIDPSQNDKVALK
jgi:hypothetical protein